MNPIDNGKQRSRPRHTGQDLRKPPVRNKTFYATTLVFRNIAARLKVTKKAAEFPLVVTDTSSVACQLPPSGFLLRVITRCSPYLFDKLRLHCGLAAAFHPLLTAPRTRRILSPRKLTAFLQRRASALARTDTNNFFNRRNKDFAVTHVARAARFDNHVNQALCLIVVYHELA